MCLQFDKGLGVLFLLLLIKFLIELKGGIRLEDPATGFLVIAFFLFSLLSIGLVRGRGDAKKSFLAGYHGIGIILGFTTIVVLCGAALSRMRSPQHWPSRMRGWFVQQPLQPDYFIVKQQKQARIIFEDFLR